MASICVHPSRTLVSIRGLNPHRRSKRDLRFGVFLGGKSSPLGNQRLETGKEKAMKRHPELVAAAFFWFYASTVAFATTVVSQTRMTNTSSNNVQETAIVAHTNAAGAEVT